MPRLLVILAVCWPTMLLSTWVDQDTPSANFSTQSFVDGRIFQIVYSDEFEVPGRIFADGADPRWTAVNKNDYTNNALHYYNENLVTTSNGFLNITTILEDVTFPISASGRKTGTKNYQSGMIQGWNKFCFTGGIVEISAKLPGTASVAGLWPALWLLGNLARATYVLSAENIWPWSYDTCSRHMQHGQQISACNVENHFDLLSHQGRGSPEIDILEAMAGYMDLANTPVSRPYFSTSLQVSPAISPYHPETGIAPDPGVWYGHGIEYGRDTSLNIFFYGSALEAYGGNTEYTTDAISANRNLNNTDYEAFHLYRLEWEPGPQGYVKWYFDNEFVFGVDANALNLTGAIIPEEPMYLIMNTAMSSTWGFPDPCPDGCACDCFDCRVYECQCSMPDGFCESLPASFLIDFVRVYQLPDSSTHSTGCSPESHPTAKYIEVSCARRLVLCALSDAISMAVQGNAYRYSDFGSDVPLKPLK
jgi:beta-glucanase (GH16 family)